MLSSQAQLSTETYYLQICRAAGSEVHGQRNGTGTVLLSVNL